MANTHFVPEFYLRGFVDTTPVANGRVWQADFEDRTVKRCSTRDACAAEDYYMPENEAAFQQIESDAARILKRLISGKPLLKWSDRLPLSKLIFTLLVRVPTFRNWLEVLNAGRRIGPTIVLNERREAIAFKETVVTKDTRMEFELANLTHYAGFFSCMSWVLLEAPPGLAFLTSDAPVHLRPGRTRMPLRSEDRMEWPDAQMSFPLSKRLCLLATWDEHGVGERMALSSDVEAMNYRRLLGADRYAVADTRALGEWALAQAPPKQRAPGPGAR